MKAYTYKMSCVFFHSQVPWLHMLYAAIGAVVYTLVSLFFLEKTQYIKGTRMVTFLISLEPTCMYEINHFYFVVFSVQHPASYRKPQAFHQPRGVCFWSTFTLCWHHPDLNFPLATSWRFHRTKAGGWHLTWCESSFYCIYSPNLSLLLNKKNIPRMDVMNTWLDLCISFKNFVLTLPFFLTVHI